MTSMHAPLTKAIDDAVQAEAWSWILAHEDAVADAVPGAARKKWGITIPRPKNYEVTGPGGLAAGKRLAAGRQLDDEIGWIATECAREIHGLRPVAQGSGAAVDAAQQAGLTLTPASPVQQAGALNDTHLTERHSRRLARRRRDAKVAGQLDIPLPGIDRRRWVIPDEDEDITPAEREKKRAECEWQIEREESARDDMFGPLRYRGIGTEYARRVTRHAEIEAGCQWAAEHQPDLFKVAA